MVFWCFTLTFSDLQRLAAGVVLAVVDRKLVADHRRVHAGVNRAQAVRIVMVAIQSQVGGVETGPLGTAQVHLQGDHSGATVHS